MTALSLVDAKTHLNITTSANDAEIQTFIDAAVLAVENAIGGPVEARAVTSTAALAGDTLLLPTTPVTALTSVTGPFGAIDTTALVIDGAAGLVSYWPAGAALPCAWPTGRGRYTVTYTAGYSPVPADLQLAIKELVRHLWTTQRGGAVRPGSATAESLSNTLAGAAFTWPIRITQLLAPYMHVVVA